MPRRNESLAYFRRRSAARRRLSFELLAERALLAVLQFSGPASATEGDSISFQLELHDNGAPIPAAEEFQVQLSTIDFSATGGVDFETFDGSLTFPSGLSSIAVEVPTIDDTNLIEGAESFQVQIVSVSGVSGVTIGFPAIGIILDNEPIATVSIEGPTVVDESAGTVPYEIVLDVPEGLEVEATASYFVSALNTGTADQLVDFSISDSIFGDFPAGAAGEVRISFSVQIIDDASTEGDETIDLELFVGSLGGVEAESPSFTITIDDDETPTDPTFTVASFEPTPSGFEVDFSRPLDATGLNLYDTQSAEFGLPDVVVEGESVGFVTGSLVLDAAADGVTFIKTGEPLSPDTYSVTLRSNSAGFKDLAGDLLDGDNDQSDGGDFTATFVVEGVANSVIVTVPDFVRGPGQAVNLPADSNLGIPITLSDAENVSRVEFQVRYDASQLELAGAMPAEGTPGEATATLTVAAPGEATVTFVSPTPLTGSHSTFVSLQASVPATASGIYGSSGLIDLHTLAITDGAGELVPSIADDAVHSVLFFGDVSGNARINGSDAALVARVGALLDGGFAATPMTDPTIIGDISGNGRINASDASKVAQFAALIPVAEIPPLPGGLNAAGFLALRPTSDLGPAVADERQGESPSAIGGDRSAAAEDRPAGDSTARRESTWTNSEHGDATLAEYLADVDAIMASTDSLACS